jgi:pimeloyl-ACP methyl ester carboxylesterase
MTERNSSRSDTMNTSITFPVGTHRFHEEPNFNYQMNRWTAFGDLPVDVMKKAAGRIKNLDDWCGEFLKLAEEAMSRRDIRRAAFYYRSVDFFLPYSDPRKKEIYDRTVSLMRELHAPYFSMRRIQEHYLPYGAGGFPVWHAPAASAKSRGTILFTGGFDCIKEELVPVMIYFSDAGYDLYYLEGPGQGETLAKEGIPMTHEWEKPVAAVLDHFKLDDVIIIGLSLGGYLAPRAAMHEKRIGRVITWGIMYDFFDVVVSRRGRFLEYFIRSMLFLGLDFVINGIVRLKMKRDPYTHWGVDHGMHVLGASSPAGYFRKLRKYSLRGIEKNITQDVLLTGGNEDHFVPPSQFHRLFNALTVARSLTARVFTAGESSENHCQFGNIGRTLDFFLAWIEFQSRKSEI